MPVLIPSVNLKKTSHKNAASAFANRQWPILFR